MNTIVPGTAKLSKTNLESPFVSASLTDLCREWIWMHPLGHLTRWAHKVSYKNTMSFPDPNFTQKMRIGTFCGKRAFWSNNKSSLARPSASCCGLYQPYKSTHLSTPPSALCQPYINHNINPQFWWGRRAIFQVTELQPSNRSSPPSSPGLKTGKQGHFSDDRWFKNGSKSDTTAKFVKLPFEKSSCHEKVTVSSGVGCSFLEPQVLGIKNVTR